MTGTFEIMTPLLLAALGGLLSERAGVLNIALEGLMLAGAFTAALVCRLFPTTPLTALALAFVASAFAGGFFATLIAWGHLRLKADLFLTGLAMNLLLPALTSWTALGLWGNQGAIRLTGLPDVRWETTTLAFAAAGGVHYFLFHTPWGLRFRAVGWSPSLLLSRGVSPARPQAVALAFSGIFAGSAGAALTFSLGAYVPGVSAGKGWIALVAVWLGSRRPLGLILACLVLAWTEQFSHLLQGLWSLPSGVVLAVPAVFTVVVYVATNAVRRK